MSSTDTQKVSSRSSVLFLGMVLAFCGWVFSLPLFPAQDAPIHKYFVEVVKQLLQPNSPLRADYAIRSGLSPYTSHYVIMLGLEKLFSAAVAEKVFVCIIIFCIAYGLRYCATAVGPGGNLISFCVAPLLLNFTLFMGFFNYTLAVGVCFIAAGIYLRARGARPSLWIVYVLVVAFLAITHPVPLLLLTVLIALDLALAFWQRRENTAQWFKLQRGPFFALCIAGIAFFLTALSADRSRSAANLKTMHVDVHTLVHFASLATLLPYDGRSTGLAINAFRLLLYILILGGIVLGARGLRTRLKSRELRASDTFLICSVVLIIAIPIIPDVMNDAFYFSSRMVIFSALAALIAAAGYRFSNGMLRSAVVAFAIVGIVFSVTIADHFFRPISRMLLTIESEPIPPNARGLVISDGVGMMGAFRHPLGIGIVDPLAWAGALTVVAHGGEILNPPWIEKAYLPLKVQPGSPLLINDLSPEEKQIMGGANDGLVRFMDPAERERLLANATFIIYTGTPQDISQGLASAIGDTQAERYACHTESDWYLACLRR